MYIGILDANNNWVYQNRNPGELQPDQRVRIPHSEAIFLRYENSILHIGTLRIRIEEDSDTRREFEGVVL